MPEGESALPNVLRDQPRRILMGAIAVLTAVYAAPSDGTRPQLPQLLTKHGAVKSGGTIQEEIQGGIDILLTDMPMTDAEMQITYDRRGVHLLHVATAVTAVVPCYNLGGIRESLNFSADALAAIFLGKITKWNDPAIVVLNPTAHLPAADIILIGHEIEDGSTYAWTDFLSKTNTECRQSIGRVRSIASQPAQFRGRTDDIAVLVKSTPNSIAFTELWAAKGEDIQIGRVRNRSGHFIDASAASMSAAAMSAAAEIRDDFRTSITDAVGAYAYPISSFTWVVIPDPFQDPEKRSVVVSFLKWVLTDGQKSSGSMHLGRLPATIADREIRVIESLR
jgi:phosphate transport system substrate-binding protein